MYRGRRQIATDDRIRDRNSDGNTMRVRTTKPHIALPKSRQEDPAHPCGRVRQSLPRAADRTRSASIRACPCDARARSTIRSVRIGDIYGE